MRINKSRLALLRAPANGIYVVEGRDRPFTINDLPFRTLIITHNWLVATLCCEEQEWSAAFFKHVWVCYDIYSGKGVTTIPVSNGRRLRERQSYPRLFCHLTFKDQTHNRHTLRMNRDIKISRTSKTTNSPRVFGQDDNPAAEQVHTSQGP